MEVPFAKKNERPPSSQVYCDEIKKVVFVESFIEYLETVNYALLTAATASNVVTLLWVLT